MNEKAPSLALQKPSAASHHAFHSALAQYPPVWYEKQLYLIGLGMGITAIGWWLQMRCGLFPNRWLSLGGLLAYSLGWLYDIYTTNLAMRFKPLFDRAKLDFPLVESGLFLPPCPTLRQQVLNWNTASELIFLTFSLLLPSVGLAAGIEHGLAGLGNYRNVQRLLRCAAILNLKT